MERLRRAGCVFAEEEAQVLRERTVDPVLLEEMCRRREAGEFLEHVVGRVRIAGETLAVGPGSFVPRARTALLIEAAERAMRHRSGKKHRAAGGDTRPVLVEAYCGVAPVASIVARRVPSVRVLACDTDPVPLIHARANLAGRGAVHRGDGLAALPSSLRGGIDVIAAVPPYVPQGAAEMLPHGVIEHEESTALFAGADGLDQVRRLIADAPIWLTGGGELLIEMGEDQAGAAIAHARARSRAPWSRTEVIRAGSDDRTVVLRLARGPISPGPISPGPSASGGAAGETA